MKHTSIGAAFAALALAGCGGPIASATKSVRQAVGNPDAKVEGLRQHWTPTYQKVVCGRVHVGPEQRRFVTLLTSDGTASSAMVEGGSPDEKTVFGEVIWGPACNQ